MATLKMPGAGVGRNQVYRQIKTADALGKATNTALNRKLKLDDALGTFRSAGGRKK